MPIYPSTYEDIDQLYREYIFENETDKDAFTSDCIQGGHSYSFYGTKVFEFSTDTLRFKFKPEVFEAIGKSKENMKPDAFYPVSNLTDDEMYAVLEKLKMIKRIIFRNTTTDVFACCSSYKECSEAGHCLKENNRMYNGCKYRKNLEQGKNFYKEIK